MCFLELVHAQPLATSPNSMETERYLPTTINLPPELQTLVFGNHKSKCPTCCRPMSLSKKTLTKTWLRPLWLINERPGITAKEIHDTLGREAYTIYKRLKYWDFIDPQTRVITRVGRRFLNNEIAVPEWLWVYNDHPRNVSKEMFAPWVTFEDLVPYEEMSREIAAAQPVPLETKAQKLL